MSFNDPQIIQRCLSLKFFRIICSFDYLIMNIKKISFNKPSKSGSNMSKKVCKQSHIYELGLKSAAADFWVCLFSCWHLRTIYTTTSGPDSGTPLEYAQSLPIRLNPYWPKPSWGQLPHYLPDKSPDPRWGFRPGTSGIPVPCRSCISLKPQTYREQALTPEGFRRKLSFFLTITLNLT